MTFLIAVGDSSLALVSICRLKRTLHVMLMLEMKCSFNCWIVVDVDGFGPADFGDSVDDIHSSFLINFIYKQFHSILIVSELF